MVYIVLCSTGSTPPPLAYRDAEETVELVEVLGFLHDTCHVTCSEGDNCGERR